MLCPESFCVYVSWSSQHSLTDVSVRNESFSAVRAVFFFSHTGLLALRTYPSPCKIFWMEKNFRKMDLFPSPGGPRKLLILSVCVCVCVCVWIGIYIYMYVYIYICINIYVCIYMYIHTYMYIHICMKIYMYIYVYRWSWLSLVVRGLILAPSVGTNSVFLSTICPGRTQNQFSKVVFYSWY